MSRVAPIAHSDDNHCSNISVSASVVEAQVYASFTLAETLTLASLSVFPGAFDLSAAAAVTGMRPDDFHADLETFVARGVIRRTSSTPTALFSLAEGVRNLLIKLPVAQDEIRVAGSRHDEYFLAQLTNERAQTSLALASEFYREFIKTNLELAAMRQIRRLVGLPAVRTGRRGGLTERQWEVAQLVAAGRTNFQIAQALGISEWTVVNHLRTVMRRLGCSSRVDVARKVLT
jgi:DNA-binding CsgD family transcriptional regulator